MLILRLWYYLTGCVLVNVSGTALEKFINLATARGIFLWGIRRVDMGVLRVNVGITGFKALKPIARITGCRIRIEKKRGIPFLMKKVEQRKMLIAGGILFVAITLILSGRLWFIQIDGGKTGNRAETAGIERILSDHGIKTGISKGNISIDDLQRDILARRNHIAWVGIQLRGTLLRIEYVKKVMPEKDTSDYSNIVAAKSGLITKILTLKGTARVMEGDTVTAGQILIEGRGAAKIETLDQPDGGEAQQVEIPGEPLKARGFVEATVYYEGYGEQSARETIVRRTGRSFIAYFVKTPVGSLTFGRKRPDYKRYEVSTKRLFARKWRNIDIPVETFKVTYHEIVVRTVILPQERTMALAEAKALKMAKGGIPGSARILNTQVIPVVLDDTGDSKADEPETDVPNGDNDDIVRMRAVVEVTEDIGREVKVTYSDESARQPEEEPAK